jgi:hypothetical protein
LGRQQTWWYKTYEFFRRDLPYFLENIWYFRKQLWSFRSWDYSYNLQILGRSLEKTVNTIEHGYEVDKTRLKKVEKMKRVIHLINRIKTENYIDQAELELGELKDMDWEFMETGRTTDNPLGEKNEKLYEIVKNGNDEDKEHNKKIFQRARDLEDLEWNELWTILRGQDLQEYKRICESKSPEEMSKNDVWGDWFDGSGMNTWWD